MPDGKRRSEIVARAINEFGIRLADSEQPVESLSGPSMVSEDRESYFSYPSHFEKREKYDVYFGIPDLIRRGDKQWEYVIIVFGTKGEYVAKVYPKADWKEFEFDEKSMIANSYFTLLRHHLRRTRTKRQIVGPAGSN